MRDFSGYASTEVVTLQDMVHALIMRSGTTAATNLSNSRIIKAIQSAVRSFHTKHRWRYYRRQARFKTSPSLTVEIDFDYTGGAEERLVTITDGDPWPTDATYGELWIGEDSYRILKRISDTQATLESEFSPSADLNEVDAIWKRRSYRFQRAIRDIEFIENVTTGAQMYQMPMGEFATLRSGTPRYFSWQNHGSEFGASEIILHPIPTVAETIEAHAAILPLVPTIHSVTGTDLSGTSGTTAVTCAGGSFSSKHIGSILRVSLNADAPTQYKSDDWTFQAFITEVPSATTLTLSEPLPASYSSRGYLISSPIDIEVSVMLEAFEDECFFQYTKNHNHQGLKDAAAIAQKSLRDAMVRDNTMCIGQPELFIQPIIEE